MAAESAAGHPNPKMTLVCLPWAAGSSTIYAPSWTKHPALTSVFSSIICVDYPGRASRWDEESIEHIDPLIHDILNKYECFNRGNEEPIVLFGHSFGAIVAFELACYLEKSLGMPPKAVFVSASVPPSKTPLVETAVSKLSADEICDYFASKGNPVNEEIRTTPELLNLFIENVRADYKCLETYPVSHAKLKTPFFVVGGELDLSVSMEDLENWGKHVIVEKEDAEINQEEKKEVQKVSVKVYPGQGHFYLNDGTVKADLGDYISQVAAALQSVRDTFPNKEEEDSLASDESDGMLDLILNAYASSLNLRKEELSPMSDFFELGGSSLDTIGLISRIESTVGVHVTQNEFFLHPRAGELAHRIGKLKASSAELPKLTPLPDSMEQKWFPASNSQEQMIWCWESNPCMYNMSTTIHFTGEAVDAQLMTKAMRFVVEQQPTLRTIVAIQDGDRFMQKVLPVSEADSCFDVKIVHAKDDCKDEVAQIVKKENQYVFPLYDPPIVRAVIIKTPSGGDFLFLSQYHVGSDSWSLVVLRRQLLEAYMSIRSNGFVSEALATSSHPNFIDWTLWNRKCLHECGVEEQQLGYWKRKLEGLPVLSLPLDKPRPQMLGSTGIQIPINISPEITNAFKAVMSSNGANMYAGLLTCYMTTLYRMGGGDDFAVGIALANRNSEGLHDLIGYFANEATVRVSFPDGVEFAETLKQVRENILEAMANADVPYHDVVKALNVPRDSSRTPVFQAFFALQEKKWWTLHDICPPKGDDLQFQLINFNSHISKFEVHMFIRDNASGGVEGELTISTDLFSESTGRRLAEMFLLLVERVAHQETGSVSSYDITPASDKKVILEANDTLTNFASSVSSVLNWVSDDSASAIFCHDSCRVVTYGELRKSVQSMHSYLKDECGLIRGDPVGLLVRSTSNAIAAIYGSVSNGCPIIIVDPEKTPCERARAIFTDAGARVLVVDSQFESTFSGLKDMFDLRLLDDAVTHVCDKTPNPEVMTTEDHFGYFYTSGTTGLPKGAIITHGNVLNLVQWWMSFFKLTQEDRVLLFSSLSFIMSLRQYLPTLCAGGTIVLPKTSVDFETAIIEGRVNKLVCTPSALGVLDIKKVAPNIDAVQVAGEPPRLSTMAAWKECVPEVFIGLGPTELTAHALCGAFDGSTICIGFPAANVKARIMTSGAGGLIEAPINVEGELWISGSNVSQGYLNRPELTAKHFSTDIETGLRCYKTGDLAKRLPDGRIQFIGRRDTQLKVNGFRLEATEIINALPSELKQAHVMVQPQGVLVLYKTKEVPAIIIKQHLDANLPSYMVPKIFYEIDAFPLNKNRKIDVPKLVADAIPEACNTKTENAMVDSNESIVRMQEIVKLEWAQSLKVPISTIDSSSNFFEIGGTSLATVLVARALNKRLGREIPVQDLFLHQELGQLAEYLCQDGDGDDANFIDSRPLHFLPGGGTVLPSLQKNILQGLGLFLMSIIVFLPVIGTVVVCGRSIAWLGMIGGAFIPAILASGCFVHLLLVFACKWVLIGRFQEGKAKVFSPYFLKWWLLRRVTNSTRLYTWAFDDTFLASYFLRLLGADIGHNVSIENICMLEPDLVRIGHSSVVEYETNFNTSEVRNGMLELRSIEIGSNVKLGARCTLLGGSHIHDNSEVAPKSVVDFSTSTRQTMQYLIGSPAKIQTKNLDGSRWKPQFSIGFAIAQIACSMLFPALLSLCLYAGVLPGYYIERRFGAYCLALYLVTAFSYTAGLVFLIMTFLLKKMLIPGLKSGHLYSGRWFLLRKWFLDRLFLSPAFAFSLQRSFEVTSSYPIYLRLLGANLGRRVWLSYITVRVGLDFLNVKDDVHTGMATYITTVNTSGEGVTFDKIHIGNDSSCGQRSIISGGAFIGRNVTVGAETAVMENEVVLQNGTIFGSPPIILYSSKDNQEIVHETQIALMQLKKRGTMISDSESDDGEEETTEPEPIGRPKPSLILPFWMYGLIMNLAQFFLPALVILPFVACFVIFSFIGYEFSFIGYDHIVLWVLILVPTIFLLGCMLLMLVIKVLQLLFFGGRKDSGTMTYYSVPFMKWYFLADMVYFCTTTIFVPFSGTEIFNAFLRLMGSRIGKGVFFSPENGGLRETDFLTVGDDCFILTPNLNSHYADHQIMQFAKVVFSKRCEINPGSTVMPLTEYGEGCILRPFSVTSKGQILEPRRTYMGYPCKAIQDHSADTTAVLFAGLGSAYPGMLKNVGKFSEALSVLKKAEGVLGMDLLDLCSVGADSTKLQDPGVAQLVVTVMNLLSVEVMKQCYPVLVSQTVVVAGFSVGEFAALCFSGAISFEDTLKLVKIQCEEFAKLKQMTSLCNVRGLSRRDVKRACKLFRCSIANIICDHHNCSNKNVFVCGGLSSDVEKLVEYINDTARARMPDDSDLNMAEIGNRSEVSAKCLRVKTANHTSFMKPAVRRFREALMNTQVTLPRDYIVYSNVTGKPYSSADEIRKYLILQMTNPVKWHEIVTNLHTDERCTQFIECGGMNSLSTMTRLILDNYQEELKLFSSDNAMNE